MSAETSPARVDRETTASGALLLRFSGDIDMTFTVANQDILEEVVAHPPHVLEFEAADLTFIDSTGLRALATLATCVRRAGGDVRTLHSSEPFRRIVEVTGLSDRFGLDESEPADDDQT